MAEIVFPDSINMVRAAQILRDGGLVAFPTETVYGLGANALDANAVHRIFAAKGRPAQNPVIVHLAELSELSALAEERDGVALLAAAFWPGPLTLVLPRKSIVPDVVTAGGPTVAVRIPRHPIALALIRAAGVPLAAPSANRSEQISPTRASHVAESLGDRIDLILDGGPTEVGLESTVLDMSVWPPRVLRPGMITPDQIAAVLRVPIATAMTTVHAQDGPMAAPGQMLRHYAPKTPLTISDNPWRVAQDSQNPIAIMALTDAPLNLPSLVFVENMPRNPSHYAAILYDTLHRLDTFGISQILVETVPDTDEWLAIRDRLTRASAS